MQRVYIAGPMSGIPASNYPAFEAEAARLRALGFSVTSPAELNAGREHEGWAACIRRDIHAMLQCDMLGLLPDWEDSRGAVLERLVAIACGLSVHLAEGITWSPDRRRA